MSKRKAKPRPGQQSPNKALGLVVSCIQLRPEDDERLDRLLAHYKAIRHQPKTGRLSRSAVVCLALELLEGVCGLQASVPKPSAAALQLDLVEWVADAATNQGGNKS